MSEGLKRKNQSASQITHYWNRALFARSFEVITDLTPEEAGRRLNDLRQTRGFMQPVSRTASVKHRIDRIYDFDLRIRRNSRGVNYTTVKATGVIVIDKGLARTVVRGDMRVGWLYALLLLATPLVLVVWWLFAPFLFYSIFLLMFLGVWAIMLVYSIWQISLDYRQLVMLIENALR